MFGRQCFTYIFCIRWENKSVLAGFFVTLQQFVTLENSSLASCIFPVGTSIRNLLWLYIVVRDAISVVYPYVLLFSFQIHEVEIFSSVDEEVVANGGEATEIVGIIANNGEATEIVDVVPDDGEATKLICVRLSVLLLTTVKQRRLFMLLLTTMKQQKLFMLLHVVVDDGKATGIGYVVPDNVFFFLNICAKFWDCLATCFKSFYP